MLSFTLLSLACLLIKLIFRLLWVRYLKLDLLAFLAGMLFLLGLLALLGLHEVLGLLALHDLLGYLLDLPVAWLACWLA